MLMDSSSSEESGSSSSSASENEEEITVTKEVINLADNEPPAESLIDRYPLEKKEELKNKLLKLAEEKTAEQNADEVEEGFGKPESDDSEYSEEVEEEEVVAVGPSESEKMSAEASSGKDVITVVTNEESEEKEATES